MMNLCLWIKVKISEDIYSKTCAYLKCYWLIENSNLKLAYWMILCKMEKPRSRIKPNNIVKPGINKNESVET